LTPRSKRRGEQQPLLDEHEPGTGTYWQTAFNSINLLLGVGVLSLPFAVRQSGWAVALPLLALLSVITNYTGKLIGKCLQIDSNMRTFPDIGFVAFGQKGRIFIAVIFFIEIFSACVMYVILMGDNMNKLFPALSSPEFMVLGFILVLPTCWAKNLTSLSYFSLLGIMSSVVLVTVLVFLGFQAHSPEVLAQFGGSVLEPRPTLLFTDLERAPLGLGLVMVGFGGHACFPNVYVSMADKTQFASVLNLTYIFTFIVYCGTAAVGYQMYGELTQQEVTLNIVNSDPGILSSGATWLIVLNPMTKFALTLFPISTSTYDLFAPYVKNKSERTKWAVQFLIKNVLAVLILIAAVEIPNFARVVSFIGAFCSFMVSGAFPCACHLKLYGSKMSTLNKAVDWFIVVL
jgi:vesicular inhibitory amino acid transporter